MSKSANEPIGWSKSANEPIGLANESIGIAPGRLDVMGGISDYSGSLLLQMPIAEQTRVTIIKRDDDIIRIQTDMEAEACMVRADEFAGIHYRELGKYLAKLQIGHWASYVLGCFSLLQQEKNCSFQGLDIHVSSSVPVGKGVSSSAALEVATVHAIRKVYGLDIDPLELAVLAQKVENLVVGAACGLMDQLAVNLGRKDHLLPIICQPYEVLEPLKIPAGIRFFGLDSGVRHAVSGASYTEVRTAAFMAYTVAMISTGISKETMRDPKQRPFGGFLANIAPDRFINDYCPVLPESMSGADFLDRFGVHIDPVTTVDRAKVYQIQKAALHPVMENHRIKQFKALLEGFESSDDKNADLRTLGDLMLASHDGYGSVGLGEPVTDRIVDLVKKKGRGHGLEGARISGGGSGGTVVVMVSSDEGLEQLAEIKSIMEKETEHELKMFTGSSDGAHYIN